MGVSFVLGSIHVSNALVLITTWKEDTVRTVVQAFLIAHNVQIVAVVVNVLMDIMLTAVDYVLLVLIPTVLFALLLPIVLRASVKNSF